MKKSDVIKLLNSLDKQIANHKKEMLEHISELKELSQWQESRISYFEQSYSYFDKVSSYISKILDKPVVTKKRETLISDLELSDEYFEDLPVKKKIRQRKKDKPSLADWVKEHKKLSLVGGLMVFWILGLLYYNGVDDIQSELIKTLFLK